MANLLQNPSFEGGWQTIAHGNQQPNGWTLTWLPNGAPLLSAGAFPGDDAPVFETVTRWPECVHKSHAELPPDEWRGGEDALVLDGVTTYKIFGGSAFSAALAQTVNAPPMVSAVLTVPVQVHHHGDGSFGACAFRIRANEYVTDWITFSGGLPDPAEPYFVPVQLAFTTPADGQVTVRIECESRAEAPIDFFIDATALTVADPEDDEDTDDDGSWNDDGDIHTFPPPVGELPAPEPQEYDYPIIATGSKLSGHGIGESGLYDLLAELAYQGAPLPFVKLYAPTPDQLPAVANLKALSPTTRFVARLGAVPGSGVNIEGPDFNSNPAAYMAVMLPVMAANPAVDYWELWNEQDPPGEDGHVRMAEFAIGCMEIARAAGFKLAVMSYSTGVPELEEWAAIYDQTDFFETCIDGGHILSLHAYCQTSDPDSVQWQLMRIATLYERLLIPAGLVVPCLLTEYGVQNSLDGWTAPELVAEYAVIDAMVSAWFYCLGLCLFTFGGQSGGWPWYNHDPYWRALADLILATRDRPNATLSVFPSLSLRIT